MSKLDPRIEAIRVKYGLEASDFWELPQKKGTWIAKHSALEIVATKANIVWTKLEIIEADTTNGIAVMAVGGKLSDREEWATGEASPKNNKNAYPWAMAEKRAKDRVVLKLSGIAGLVYSEDEADDFKQSEPTPSKANLSSTRPVESPKTFAAYGATITAAKTPDDLKDAFAAIWKSSLSQEDKDTLKTAYEAKKVELANPGYVAPSFDNLQSEHHGDRV